MFCKEHIFFDWCIIFLNGLSIIYFFGQSVHHPSVWPLSVIQQTHSMWNSFVHSLRAFIRMLILTIVHGIVWVIMCMIVRTIFLVGPGFEPLASHAIFFVGPRFDSLTLQHDLFVSPGFNSWTQAPVSGPYYPWPMSLTPTIRGSG